MKLPPLLIFCGKTGVPKEKILQSNIHCLNKEVYIKCQENSWTDNIIFLLVTNHYRNIRNALLILDRSTTHFDISINKLFEKY